MYEYGQEYDKGGPSELVRGWWAELGAHQRRWPAASNVTRQDLRPEIGRGQKPDVGRYGGFFVFFLFCFNSPFHGLNSPLFLAEK